MSYNDLFEVEKLSLCGYKEQRGGLDVVSSYESIQSRLMNDLIELVPNNALANKYSMLPLKQFLFIFQILYNIRLTMNNKPLCANKQ